MRFYRVPSTVYEDDAFHAVGRDGRRYTITREGRIWLLTLHTGYGHTHSRVGLLTAPYAGRDYYPVLLLEKRAMEHEATETN